MDKNIHVISTEPKVNPEALDVARSLLEHISKGDIQSFAFVGITNDRGYVYGLGGESDCISMLGATSYLSHRLDDLFSENRD